MPIELFAALVVFASVMAFTPGPNNVLLAASGVNFGFARTIPHITGVTLGFDVLLIACGLGLGLVFTALPNVQTVLKIAGAVYMLWLAYKVATAQQGREAAAPARPFTFLQAAAFQWVNPKAVLAVVSGIAIYVRPDHQFVDFVIVIAVFTVVTLFAVLTWVGFGAALRVFLKDPRHARLFNFAMAALLVVSIVPMVWPS